MEREQQREQQIKADIIETEKQLAEFKGSNNKQGGQSQEEYLKGLKLKLAKQRDNLGQIITRLNESIQQSENKIETIEKDKAYKMTFIEKERKEANKADEEARIKTAHLAEKTAACEVKEKEL